eukprot:3451266-Amphidinium_carterae.1
MRQRVRHPGTPLGESVKPLSKTVWNFKSENGDIEVDSSDIRWVSHYELRRPNTSWTCDNGPVGNCYDESGGDRGVD